MDTCGLSMWDRFKVERYRFLKETAIVATVLLFAVLLVAYIGVSSPNMDKNIHDITDEIAYTYDSIRIGKISMENGYIKIDSLTMELKNDIKNNSRK